MDRTDRSRVRTALALIGAVAIAVGGAAPSAGAQATLQWEAREFQTDAQGKPVFGPDDAVDIAYWKDDSVVPVREWVYMTGYQTTASGATVFATYKYDANDPGPIATFDKERFYPIDPATATGTNRAVAIAVDPLNGDVYVTGESFNPNEPTGLDYVTIKYDKDLDPDLGWITAGHPGAVVRWDNPIFAGPTSHDRPVDIALAKLFDGSPSDNVIGITGRSYGGPATKYDIVTVLMEAGTGNPWSAWGDVGLGLGARSFNGDADSNDSAVGLDLYWGVSGMAGAGLLYTVVAGTTRYLHSGQPNDDIVTIQYDPNGNRTGSGWTNVYNGPMNGDDVATAMVVNLKNGGVFVCGYTPHYYTSGSSASPGAGRAAAPEFLDTDYIVLGYHFVFGEPWIDWAPFGPPNARGVRVWNGPGPATNKSDDRAMDITLDANPDPTGWRVWLTGHVREADGVGYDVATISYLACPPRPPNPRILPRR